MIPAKVSTYSPSTLSHAVHQRVQPIAIPVRSQPLQILPNTPELRARIQGFHQRCMALGIAELVQFLPNCGNEQNWTIAIEQYGCFLCLMSLYPDRPLVPTPILDQVWHVHILDTQRYRRDCLALFGQFIDHQPLGTPALTHPTPQTPHTPHTPHTLPDHVTAYAETSQLFRHHFQLDLSCDREAIASMGSAHSSGLNVWQYGACGRGLSKFDSYSFTQIA